MRRGQTGEFSLTWRDFRLITTLTELDFRMDGQKEKTLQKDADKPETVCSSVRFMGEGIRFIKHRLEQRTCHEFTVVSKRKKT